MTNGPEFEHYNGEYPSPKELALKVNEFLLLMHIAAEEVAISHCIFETTQGKFVLNHQMWLQSPIGKKEQIYDRLRKLSPQDQTSFYLAFDGDHDY